MFEHIKNFSKKNELKVNNKEILEPLKEEKTVDELNFELEQARAEIDALISEAKQPLQQSKNAAKKRYSEQLNSLKKKYDEYIQKADDIISEFNQKVDEHDELLERLNKISEDMAAREKELTTEKDDLQKREQDYKSILEAELKEKERIFAEEKKAFEDSRDDMILAAEAEIQEAKAKAELELDDLKKDCEKWNDDREILEKEINELKDKRTRKEKLVKDIEKVLNKKFAIIGTSIILIIAIIVGLFHPYLMKKENIYTSANKVLSSDFTELNMTILATVNNQTIFKGNFFHGLNKYLGEEYSRFILSDSLNEFNWERYTKGNSMFFKTPYEPQYIYTANYTGDGVRYIQDEIEMLENSLLNNVLSYTDISETFVSGAESGENVFWTFINYVKNKIIPNSISYQFNADTKVIPHIYEIISNTAMYQNFLEEESYFNTKLETENLAAVMDTLLETVFIHSNYKTSNGRFTINKNNLNEIVINFNGINDAGENISLFITINMKISDKNTSYDNSEFLLNSMEYRKIYPRIEQDTFQESENSQIIQENITTVVDLENQGFNSVP